MFKNKKILCLMPARGGSKGLPKKNIKLLVGTPLIGWSIEAALDSKYIDKIIVSTDDEKIAGVARKFGAEVPFVRPAYLATSKARMTDVLKHAIDFSVRRGDNFDLVLLLQPTSPLREAKDIDCAIELFFNKKAGAVVSVCEAEHHPWLSGTIPSSLSLRNFIVEKAKNSNRQDLPVYYRLNGAIYLADVNYFRKNNGFMARKTFAYIMPAERSVDIDNKLDFEFAEFLKGKRRCQKQ